MFLVSLFKFSLSSSTSLSSQVQVSILMTISLNSSSGRLLISISFSSFSEVLSCSFSWSIFLCLLILFDCLCFCVFISSHKLEGVILCRNVPCVLTVCAWHPWLAGYSCSWYRLGNGAVCVETSLVGQLGLKWCRPGVFHGALNLCHLGKMAGAL